MKKEELVEIGLSEEQINEVFKLNGLALENLKTKNKVIIEDLEAKNEELNTKVSTLTTDLEGVPNVEELTKEIEDYKSKITNYEEEVANLQSSKEEELNKVRYEFMLENSLKEAGFRSTEIAKAVINSESIKLVDGKLEGFEDEVKRLSEEHDYLFITPESDSGPKVPKYTTGKTQQLKKNGDKQVSAFEDRLSKYN